VNAPPRALARHRRTELRRYHRLLGAAAAELGERRPLGASSVSCSNELTEVRFDDGATLMIKRSRYAWDGPRFRASRRTASLIRRRTGVVAPHHLDVPEEVDGRFVEAYWRIELPTLRELWPTLDERQRRRAFRSWGELLRRVHTLRLAGHGAVERAEREPTALADFLEEELVRRLLPSVRWAWPRGRAAVSRLSRAIPDVVSRVGARRAVLVHNDPHWGNVLCEVRGTRVRCVGVLDLEAAIGGPPEADLAHVEVLHGPLFGQRLEGSWLEEVRTGYGAELDPLVLSFFRVYHLLNLGYHAALMGWTQHADDVALAARREVARFT